MMMKLFTPLRRLPLQQYLRSYPHHSFRVISSISSPSCPSPSSSASILQVVREYNVKASPKEEYIEVPIPMYGIAGRYASSLYVTAMRANALEPVFEELQEVVNAAKGSPTFNGFLNDPTVPTEVRIKAMLEIFGEAGFSELTVNLLALLAENRRLAQLSMIADAFTELVRAHRGEVKATVTATAELTPKEVEQLKESLNRFIKPGQYVILDQKIDPSILGGILVDIGEKHIDLSIERQVKEVEKLLSEPI